MIPDFTGASCAGLSGTRLSVAARDDVSKVPDAPHAGTLDDGVKGWRRAMPWRRALPVCPVWVSLPWLGVMSKGPDCPSSCDGDPHDGRKSIGWDLVGARVSGTKQASRMADYSPIAGVRPLVRVNPRAVLDQALRGRALGSPRPALVLPVAVCPVRGSATPALGRLGSQADRFRTSRRAHLRPSRLKRILIWRTPGPAQTTPRLGNPHRSSVRPCRFRHREILDTETRAALEDALSLIAQPLLVLADDATGDGTFYTRDLGSREMLVG